MPEAKVTITGTPEEPILNFDLPAGPKGEPGGWNIGTNLGSTDLNTITTPGLYWNGSTSSTQNPELHYPPMSDPNNQGTPRGTLQVQSWSGGNLVLQTYVRLGSGAGTTTQAQRPRVVFHRYKEAYWSEWSTVLPSKLTSDANGYRSLQVWDDDSNAWAVVTGPGGWTDGAGLGALNLNAVTTPGLYRQNNGGRATLANNYPRAGDAGALSVMAWGGAGEVLQQYTLYPTQTSTLSSPGTFSRGCRGGNWSPWVHSPSQRVDNTAGKAIYTWDDTVNKEQLVYGNTGVRNINSLAAGLNTSAETGGDPAILISREGSTVTLMFENIKPLAKGDWTIFTTLPAGFRPRLKNPTRYFMLAAANGVVVPKSMFFYTSGAMNIFGADTADIYRQTITYPTVDAWPTALPGTAL